MNHNKNVLLVGIGVLIVASIGVSTVRAGDIRGAGGAASRLTSASVLPSTPKGLKALPAVYRKDSENIELVDSAALARSVDTKDELASGATTSQ